MTARPIKIFYCYAHEDKALRHALEGHLGALKRSGLIQTWYDHEIMAGSRWEREIEKRLNTSDIILLLVSHDFMNSDYCWNVEVPKALQLHKTGKVQVIPIILRPVHLKNTPIEKLQMLPVGGIPVTSNSWPSQDDAFVSVVEEIQRVVDSLKDNASSVSSTTPGAVASTLLSASSFSALSSVVQKVPRRAFIIGLVGVVGGAGVGVYLISQWVEQISQGVPLGTTRFLKYAGHSSAVHAVAWSPDGTSIVSGDDLSVQVWVSGTGIVSYTFQVQDTNAGGGVAWSPDNTTIAAGDGNNVQVWSTVTGKHSLTYHGHSDSVNDVRWLLDGKHIVSASSDNTVQIWEVASGHTIVTYKGHSDSVYALACSPDGLFISSAANDKTVQVWDMRGNQVVSYQGHSDAVNAVGWSLDGRYIVSGSKDSTVQLWDAHTGKHFFTYRGHSDVVNAVAWSPRAARIASASNDQTVQLWDVSTGKNVFTYPGHQGSAVNAAVWSPDGTRIASGGVDQTIQVWQAK